MATRSLPAGPASNERDVPASPCPTIATFIGHRGTRLRTRAWSRYLETERVGRVLADLLRVDPGDRVARTAWRRSLRDYPRRRRGQTRGVVSLSDSPSRAPCRSHCSD